MNARLQHFIDSNPASIIDPDPEETTEWREAFSALIAVEGTARACQILDMLCSEAHHYGVQWKAHLNTPYRNTISLEQQAAFPGDIAIERKLGAIIRWNALVMVVRANQAYGELGGHVASYASAADLFETGYHHFFHAKDAQHGGDLVFFQPHSAPGVYARAFLEGRLSENDLLHYRQEISATQQGVQGLSSYPHPWLMPDFWQFPTGSMGIGPISSIYHARFMRYLSHRKLLECSQRVVWGVFGDGEMDEPESMSALTLAAREGLDNLVWVVNCNLQRLDGPVRGNGRIIDELERLFIGAGWNVIKCLWGSDWDGLFAQDSDGCLLQALTTTVDGQMQSFAAKDGAYNRSNFFGQHSSLQKMAEGMSDAQIDQLKRGGHDPIKIYAAYAAARQKNGRPSVVLAHTKKGYGMGSAGEGKMTTHSQKKLDADELIAFRRRFDLPISDEQAAALEFIKPAEDSDEMRYLHQRRLALGGYLPKRQRTSATLEIPPLDQYANFALQSNLKEMSTTMAFVRMLGSLLKDAQLGPRIVPIVADEARTFGMANLFKQVGIYSSQGQQYAPEDIGSVLSYREAVDGQILEEGISEAGAIASWTAAATSYSVHDFPMLPFYIYYSMFGFQRVGDAIWAAADQRARGFLLGATSGRTTLGGEGLQHQDGSSHLVAATIPNCKAYDPAFASELAIILNHGMHAMLVEQQDVFYYITLMNENYAQQNLTAGKESEIIQGAYLLQNFSTLQSSSTSDSNAEKAITLLGSGAILLEALDAAKTLFALGWSVDVISVTSWSELERDGARTQHNTQADEQTLPHITQLLQHCRGPVIAASDYVRAVPESIRAYIPAGKTYTTLGTDGFGRSDTREKLREYFSVNSAAIVRAALSACNHLS
jgi:pyruvate dehydrogenase E1 component